MITFSQYETIRELHNSVVAYPEGSDDWDKARTSFFLYLTNLVGEEPAQTTEA